jgi:protein-tyrosine phosphatase
MTRAIVVLVILTLAWAGVYYAHWVVVRRRFVAIAPGRVYQSAAMSPRRLICYVRRYAVHTVIDFRGLHELGGREQARALAESGIRYINIPIVELPTQSDLRGFIDAMTEELANGRRVLMHCKDGEGRAVAMAAVYRIELEGWSPMQAYRAATRLPPGFKLVSMLFPSTGLLSSRNCKSRFILDYRPMRPAFGSAYEARMEGANSISRTV